MRKVMKYTGYLALGLVAILVVLVLYVSYALPSVGDAPKDLKVEITPEKVERGKYLAYHVMMCVECHSERDFRYFAGPSKPGTEAAGGDVFDHKFGFPGSFVSANLTPFNLKDWTDGEIFRLITTGVRKNGEPIFPVMPYLNYGQLDPEDIEAVIAYLRTLEPVETKHAQSSADFPFNLILRTIPAKASPTKRPDPSDEVAYGKYMVTASACIECHTNFADGKFIGEPFAGGRSFKFPDGSLLTSPNITPHASGLGGWTKEMFIQRFKMYAEEGMHHKEVKPGELQTMMPWLMYSGMTEQDLSAIYAYLRTVPPVENYVVKYLPAGE
jgi:hypothetical protein